MSSKLGVGREAKNPTLENLLLQNQSGGQDLHRVLSPVKKKKEI